MCVHVSIQNGSHRYMEMAEIPLFLQPWPGKKLFKGPPETQKRCLAVQATHNLYPFHQIVSSEPRQTSSGKCEMHHVDVVGLFQFCFCCRGHPCMSDRSYPNGQDFFLGGGVCPSHQQGCSQPPPRPQGQTCIPACISEFGLGVQTSFDLQAFPTKMNQDLGHPGTQSQQVTQE